MPQAAWSLLFLLLSILHPLRAEQQVETQGRSSSEQADAASLQFFDAVDRNNDGEIDENEAREFIGESLGGSEFNTAQKVEAAVDRMKSNVDGEDPLATISQEEFRQHLKRLMQGGSVVEWVRHGLGLPQLEEVFKRNAITALDFPLLVENEGAVLEDDMKVSSLQRGQIVRSLKYLILGLGKLPPDPQDIQCSERDCEMTSVSWKLPSIEANPPVHKFVIEGRSVLSGSQWVDLREVEMPDVTQEHFLVGLSSQQDQFQYRVTAWSRYGRSEKVEIVKCKGLPQKTALACSNNDKLPTHSVKDTGSHIGGVGKDVRAMTEDQSEVATSSGSLSRLIWAVIVLLLTIGIRFLHSRHISFATCLAFCGLSRVAKMLHLKGWEPLVQVECEEEFDRDVFKRDRHQSTRSFDNMKSSTSTDSLEFFREHRRTIIDSPSPSKRDGDLRKVLDSFAEGDNYPGHGTWSDTQSGDNEGYPSMASTSWDGILVSQDDASLTEFPEHDHAELVTGRCSFEGCKVHWRGLRKLRKRLLRHFCGICQLSYCGKHTSVSPHGPLSSCGQQSRCVCVNCFKSLSPERQKQLERTNRLNSSSGWSSKSKQEGSGRRWKGLSQKSVDTLVGSPSVSARALRNWARAGRKVKAVCRFRRAGRELAFRQQADLTGKNQASELQGS